MLISMSASDCCHAISVLCRVYCMSVWLNKRESERERKEGRDVC